MLILRVLANSGACVRSVAQDRREAAHVVPFDAGTALRLGVVEAMQKLGRQIGISDVALAKHCRNHDIPVPERGYWNKLSAGKRSLGSLCRYVT